VDRGYGLVEEISRSVRSFQVAVIFFGGKDDREALAYAGRVARHPGVKLTVIRFLLDSDSENASRRAGNYRINAAEQEEEMKLDDECFAQFYERHIAGGHVSYNGKHVANSAETYATLRSLEPYGLIIVGRGANNSRVRWCKDYGHHLSPHWYDIVHFGPKPSWICSWAIPKKPHTNGDICPSLYTHDPPHF